MARELRVLLNDREIGSVHEGRGGRRTFLYDTAWQSSAEAVPLSLSMPLARREHAHKTITNFVWGLLFERRAALEAIAAARGVSPENPIALASLLGEDMAGAIQMVPPDAIATLRGREGVAPISVKRLGRFIDDLQRDPGLLQLDPEAAHFSLAGAQPKKAICWMRGRWYEPKGRTPSTHILKPPMVGFDAAVENEHICLAIARALGLPAAQSSVVDIDGRTVIIVERYDRVRIDRTGQRLALTDPGGSVLRVHQEDICQALAIHPRHKYQWQKGPGLRDVMQLLESSSRPDIDRRRFIRATALNYLLAAPDAHAKNFSLLLGEGGRFRLAPLYDVISALPYDTDRYERMAMSIGGERLWRRIGPEHWAREAKTCRYDPDRALADVAEMIGALPDVVADVVAGARGHGLQHPLIDRLVDQTAERCRQLAPDFPKTT